MIARGLYGLLWYAATPLIKRYLKKRARRAPAYLEHWEERFRGDGPAASQGAIWIHAVSVGETRAARPLVDALRERWPDAPLLVTQMTPTGRAIAVELYGAQAAIRYLPYDHPRHVQDFLQKWRPRFGVLMETELWPNLVHAAHELDIPLFLANARLSDKSYRGYRRVGSLIRATLSELSGVAAQGVDDAERLGRLGAHDPAVCGNTKYDFLPPADKLAQGAEFRRALGTRPVLVCASTREGEEALILQAWRRRRPDGCLLVLVPRHPERFDAVAEQATALGFELERRSRNCSPAASCDVWLGDSMGEMFAYYAAADLVFVGGSLLPLGGQNLIEAASVGVPVLMGPSTFNFAEASARAFAAGAALQVEDADAMVEAAEALLRDEPRRRAMGAAAAAFCAAHRGASARIVAFIASRLDKA
ncbi:lipid IV(A) 3-deoxy-D-manno-octulosonic acid transferase [Paludibacterium yongneupense]|uniref:lipid IV(A) 3-deoxy-D-manno-octulosonic acid transferase n=1 Tax=Paludibacterium yongneupense TaxID=400061 RepID=UPI0004142E9B|nr:lipid IV(A) 3-deoxy-D-manno-octulosonic acid transferase [Paludibacterium yongneupense]